MTSNLHKRRVLILGGCGFIGRNLVQYIITNDLASEIRVVDKTPPQMAYLNQTHANTFNNPLVEFYSANLINPLFCKNAFKPSINGNWEIVFNCAAETRSGQSDAIYHDGITKLSLNCANESANHDAQRYVELSSGNMHSSEKMAIDEDCTVEPWTLVAKYKSKVENQLKCMPSLQYTVLRLPIVYGIGDRRNLTPRITVAAIYKYLNEPMKLLWNEFIRMDTVHVTDVVTAMWKLAIEPQAVKQVYNIVDDSKSTQGSISNILADIFDIKVEYWGTLISSITKVKMHDVLEEINDTLMEPWSKACKGDGIENTPLMPYMDEEQLYHKHLYLDNAKLKATGYNLVHSKMTRKLIEEIIMDFVNEKHLPASLKWTK